LDESDPHKMGGTPTYMAPELFRGGQASVASDIYALGILLYYLLTGKYPVDAPTLPEFTSMHEANSVQSLYDMRSDLPEKLVQVVERAIRKNPAERFQSAGQMLSALSESVGAASMAPMTPTPPALPQTSKVIEPRAKRSWWWIAIP